MAPATLADAHKLAHHHAKGHRQVCPGDCQEKRPHAHLDGRIVTIGSKSDTTPAVRHAKRR